MSLVRNERDVEDLYNVKKPNGDNVTIEGETQFRIEHAGEQNITNPGDPMDKAWTQEMEDRVADNERFKFGEVVASATLVNPVSNTVIVTPSDFGNGSYYLIFYDFTSINGLILK